LLTSAKQQEEEKTEARLTDRGMQTMAYYGSDGVGLAINGQYGVEMRPVQAETTAWSADLQDIGPLCFHGSQANSVECKKEGLYQGKRLWLCGAEGDKCQLFLEEQDLANPKCRCGVHTRENTVKKETQNQGRKFLACGARKCKFFKWL
jgi:hypothetical protein